MRVHSWRPQACGRAWGLWVCALARGPPPREEGPAGGLLCSCCLVFQCAKGFADMSVCFPKLFAEDKIFILGVFHMGLKDTVHSVESNWHSIKIDQICF